MILPEGWEAFYNGVCDRTKALTKSGIWNTDASSMHAWLGNFSEDKHRYVAAHILDRLTFRTEKMTESAFRLYLSSIFREFCQHSLNQVGTNVEDWLAALRNSRCAWTNEIKLCSVSKAGEHGESGSHMIRILTGSLFSEKYIFPVDTQLLSSVRGNIILIVDDFVGSGDQFLKFAIHHKLEEAARNNRIIYAPSVAYHKGIENISKRKYPIKITPLEILSKKEQFFSHEKDARFFGDDVNEEKDILKVYSEMRQLSPNFMKQGNNSYWLGRDYASLCVGFQWGCPNQSLGMMWLEGDANWQRLVRRRGSQ
jgi:hypothetical protein